MKITLVIPPQPRFVPDFSSKFLFPPLGVTYIAAVFRTEWNKCRVNGIY